MADWRRNSRVFVRADLLGLQGTELPGAIEASTETMDALEAIRGAAAVAMGLAETAGEATTRSPSNPKIALVSPPHTAATLAGDTLSADAMDLTIRMVSVGQPHRAVPLTGAMCLAVAAKIQGTIANEMMRTGHTGDVRIGHPSGVIELAADVQRRNQAWHADRVVVYRTARRLMEGSVLIPKLKRGAAAATVE